MIDKQLKSKKEISIWLVSICILILITIVVGGITRLTGSGLSMVDWQPIYGIMPPITDLQWQTLFNQYQQFPEYIKKNYLMTLNEFKFIFFWEYIHRIIGRIIGLTIMIPYIYFLIKKQLNKRLKINGMIMIILVIGQGLMGWYMVKSGLIDEPNVSHYRLTAHLGLALLLLQFTFWNLLSINKTKKNTNISKKIKITSVLTTVVLVLQIIYGAFTAGLKAGYGFNTYPKMLGEWFPESIWLLTPYLMNILENPIMIQLIHRKLGILLLLCIFLLWLTCLLQNINQTSKKLIHLVLSLTIIQIILGITTLVYIIPLPLAVLHQLTATILLTIMIWFNHSIIYK